ncbi:unnamed protein product [Mytilus coruscus]|uniref:Uncharacterized protein n=1 Tax=Mytilus coruscus TaxID=42192 RepID=A0A6J8BN64_MYTCO|nr:unnamed protein product [Mytilus coruscus]
MTKWKRKLPVMFAKRFSDDIYDKIEKILNRIVERSWMVSIFNVKTHDQEDLWEKLTDGIMRAWSFEGKKDCSYLDTELINLGQIDFISKHVAGIDRLSKKELFGGYDLQTQSKSTDHLQHAFVNAFVGKRSDTINEILSWDSKLGLTKENYKTLCQQVFKSPTSKPVSDMNGLKLLEGKEIRSQQEREVPDREISKEEVEAAVYRLRTRTAPWPDQQFAELKKKKNKVTALVSNIYLTALADKAEQLFEETLQADILSHSRKFSSRAVKLLDKMFTSDEKQAKEALDCVSEVWDHKESPLHFGHQFNMEEFISHPSAQKDASKRMFPYANEDETSLKENTEKDAKSLECLPFIKVINYYNTIAS